LFIKKKEKNIAWRRWILVFLTVGSATFYFIESNKLTCPERVRVLDSKGNDSSYTIHIIAGNELIDTTDAVLNKINKSSLRCSLCDSLATHDPTKIWTGRSITAAETRIVWSYIFFVVFLVSLITHFIEELIWAKDKKEEEKNKGAIDKDKTPPNQG
jgi:hypothetical protein